MLLREPYVKDKVKHGRLRSFLISAQEWGVRRVILYLDGLLVASEESLRQVSQAFPEYHGQVIKIDLPFEDRFRERTSKCRYFSFVGHAVPAKGIDIF